MASLALGHANTWTGAQTFTSGDLILKGATSGTTTLNASATASGVLTLPAATDTVAVLALAQTFTNKTISGASNSLSAIANASLTNSTITIAGVSTALGGSITASAILDSLGAVQGDVAYRNATGWVVLAPGTNGQLLTSGGASANVSWTTVSGGSGTVTSVTSANSNITVATTTTTPVLTLASALTSLNSVTAASATNFVATGGSSGAALTLGQGTNGAVTLQGAGTGNINIGTVGGGLSTITIGGTSGSTGAGFVVLACQSGGSITFVDGSQTITWAGAQFYGPDIAVNLGAAVNRWENLYLGPNGLHIANGTSGGATITTTGASGSEVLNFNNAGSGAAVFNASIQTAAGATAASGAWKFGALRTSTALVASTTQVIQIDIGGTLFSLMTCSTNP